jgi:hypothetical protein
MNKLAFFSKVWMLAIVALVTISGLGLDQLLIGGRW